MIQNLETILCDLAARCDSLEMFVASKVVLIQRVPRVQVLNGD